MRRRGLPAALAISALLFGMAPGPGPGASSSCSPGFSTDVRAASTPGQPVPVLSNADVICPTPENTGSSSFGPPSRNFRPQPGTPGDPCTTEVWRAMEVSLTPGNQPQVFWADPTWNGNGSDTPEPQFVSRIIGGIDAKTFFEEAGTTDFWNPFILDGKLDASGFNCVPKDPQDPQASFRAVCNVAPIPIGCLRANQHTIGGGPLPITALQGGLVDLRAKMTQLIHPGQITSLPAQPNPALVNSPACFFVNGADIDGRDVNADQEFEMVLIGPNDGTGRHVFYVFRIKLALQSVAWTFGDGTGTTEQLPAPCIGVSSAPLQYAHRYLRYSPAAGFPVGAIETFTLHVTEYLYDSAGQPWPAQDLGDFEPIVVNPGPPGGFRKVVVQEEGVPVG